MGREDSGTKIIRAYRDHRPHLWCPMNTAPAHGLHTKAAVGRADSWEGVMHPMFVKLFVETDADDLLVYEEEEKRRQSRRARHNQARTMTTVRRQGRSSGGGPSRLR